MGAADPSAATAGADAAGKGGGGLGAGDPFAALGGGGGGLGAIGMSPLDTGGVSLGDITGDPTGALSATSTLSAGTPTPSVPGGGIGGAQSGDQAGQITPQGGPTPPPTPPPAPPTPAADTQAAAATSPTAPNQFQLGSTPTVAGPTGLTQQQFDQRYPAGPLPQAQDPVASRFPTGAGMTQPGPAATQLAQAGINYPESGMAPGPGAAPATPPGDAPAATAPADTGTPSTPSTPSSAPASTGDGTGAARGGGGTPAAPTGTPPTGGTGAPGGGGGGGGGANPLLQLIQSLLGGGPMGGLAQLAAMALGGGSGAGMGMDGVSTGNLGLPRYPQTPRDVPTTPTPPGTEGTPETPTPSAPGAAAQPPVAPSSTGVPPGTPGAPAATADNQPATFNERFTGQPDQTPAAQRTAAAGGAPWQPPGAAPAGGQTTGLDTTGQSPTGAVQVPVNGAGYRGGRDVAQAHAQNFNQRMDPNLRNDRQRYRDELARKPWLKEKALAIMYNEQGRNPHGTQSIMETAMNRASIRGTSLEHELRWHRQEPNGYYQVGNKGRGMGPYREVLERSFNNALAGSNLANYATDNSSGSLAAREARTGAFNRRQGYTGETFFAPGHAEPGFARSWQQWHQRMTGGQGDQGKMPVNIEVQKGGRALRANEGNSIVGPARLASQLAPEGIPYESWRRSENVEDARGPQSLSQQADRNADVSLARQRDVLPFMLGQAPPGASSLLAQQAGLGDIDLDKLAKLWAQQRMGQ